MADEADESLTSRTIEDTRQRIRRLSGEQWLIHG
jgi:hypothetical protein